MVKILGVLTAMMLAGPGTHAQTTVSPTTDATLIAKERALYQAVAKGDRTAFVSLALPDGIWATKQGFVPAKLLADGLDAYALAKWDIVNPRVTWLGSDSALVTYVWQGSGTFQNQALFPTTLALTVWTRRDGKWVAAHHQETDLTK
jgi:hypothetical protein